jgi:hypothetical protein
MPKPGIILKAFSLNVGPFQFFFGSRMMSQAVKDNGSDSVRESKK